jgi:hypothetical protein
LVAFGEVTISKEPAEAEEEKKKGRRTNAVPV